MKGIYIVSEDFSNYPPSIGEVRSDRSRNAADWCPRDALIECLRSIDSGDINPDAIIIVRREKVEPGSTITVYSAAAPDIHTSIGMLEYTIHKLMRDVE